MGKKLFLNTIVFLAAAVVGQAQAEQADVVIIEAPAENSGVVIIEEDLGSEEDIRLADPKDVVNDSQCDGSVGSFEPTFEDDNCQPTNYKVQGIFKVYSGLYYGEPTDLTDGRPAIYSGMKVDSLVIDNATGLPNGESAVLVEITNIYNPETGGDDPVTTFDMANDACKAIGEGWTLINGHTAFGLMMGGMFPELKSDTVSFELGDNDYLEDGTEIGGHFTPVWIVEEEGPYSEENLKGTDTLYLELGGWNEAFVSLSEYSAGLTETMNALPDNSRNKPFYQIALQNLELEGVSAICTNRQLSDD